MMMKTILSMLLVSSGILLPAALAQSAQVNAQVPFQYAVGKKLFEENCAACHGATGDGSYEGPPLMHKIYEPSHHGDNTFFRAVLNGVRAHHWNFGDMPPVPGMDERKVSKILPYVRWMQRQNGIQ